MDSSHRLVVGVDGSTSSLDALRWALNQAQLTNAEVEAVISWQYPTQYGTEFYGEEINWEQIATSTLESSLNELGDYGSVQVTPRVIQGHPAEVLLDAAKGADLLVVGSRGHGGFVGMLVGSVSVRVIAHATCPVLVVCDPNRTSS